MKVPLNRTIATLTLLCVVLSGCVELSYIRPVVSDARPPIDIPAKKEIRRTARSADNPVSGLIEAPDLPQFQVAQYACQQARILPASLGIEWSLFCAQRIVELIRNKQDVLDGGQALQQLYNEAAAQIFKFVRDKKDPAGRFLFEGSRFVILEQQGSDQVRQFSELLVSSSLALHKFDHRYTRDGFGVPFIGFQENPLSGPADALYPPQGRSYAYTGIVDFSWDPERGKYMTQLHLLDPATHYVAFGRCEYPLAGDFSAPYAYLLSRSSLKQVAWSGFFEFEDTEDQLGLFLMQPYDPDKIPLVMVHGLLSSPKEWTQLTNTVLGEDLARHYQVWHYVYPSSAPFLYSATLLRKKLEQTRTLLDPELDDFATNNMVFVAHSMGGLVTKALVIDSGVSLWDAAFSTHIDALKLSPVDREQLRGIFFLKAETYIKRIVFLGTPHHGSDFANGWVGSLGASLTRRPAAMKSLLIRVTSDNPNCMTEEMDDILSSGGPTSVRGLSPDHPVTRVFASIPMTPTVPFHSIIGSGSRSADGVISDGIVTYASAHLEGAESEFVVPVKHTKYDEPEVVEEIVDILRLHLDTDLAGDLEALRNR